VRLFGISFLRPSEAFVRLIVLEMLPEIIEIGLAPICIGTVDPHLMVVR
jgi:hypothetical protein